MDVSDTKWRREWLGEWARQENLAVAADQVESWYHSDDVSTSSGFWCRDYGTNAAKVASVFFCFYFVQGSCSGYIMSAVKRSGWRVLSKIPFPEISLLLPTRTELMAMETRHLSTFFSLSSQ
jgi:hypothetical protein